MVRAPPRYRRTGPGLGRVRLQSWRGCEIPVPGRLGTSSSVASAKPGPEPRRTRNTCQMHISRSTPGLSSRRCANAVRAFWPVGRWACGSLGAWACGHLAAWASQGFSVFLFMSPLALALAGTGPLPPQVRCRLELALVMMDVALVSTHARACCPWCLLRGLNTSGPRRLWISTAEFRPVAPWQGPIFVQIQVLKPRFTGSVCFHPCTAGHCISARAREANVQDWSDTIPASQIRHEADRNSTLVGC